MHTYDGKKLKRGIYDNVFRTTEDETIEDVRNFVQMLTGSQKFEVLGQGVYASVYKNKMSDTVLKVGVVGENHGYLAFLRTVRKYQDNPFFPKIYHACLFTNGDGCDFFVIKMERLIRGKNYVKSRLHMPGWWRVAQFIQACCRKPGNELDNFMGQPTPRTLYNAMYVLKRSFRANKFMWDIHEENMMMRPDGQLVITDPWSELPER